MHVNWVSRYFPYSLLCLSSKIRLTFHNISIHLILGMKTIGKNDLLKCVCVLVFSGCKSLKNEHYTSCIKMIGITTFKSLRFFFTMLCLDLC